MSKLKKVPKFFWGSSDENEKVLGNFFAQIFHLRRALFVVEVLKTATILKRGLVKYAQQGYSLISKPSQYSKFSIFGVSPSFGHTFRTFEKKIILCSKKSVKSIFRFQQAYYWTFFIGEKKIYDIDNIDLDHI